MESFKRPAKRKASEKCPVSLKVLLPRCVSDWRRSNLSLLHIYYDEDFLDEPLDVLSKIPSLVELNRNQIEYIEKAKQFLKFEASVEKLQFNAVVVKSSTTKLYAALENQSEKLVTVMTKRFIMALDRLLDDVQHAFRNFKTYEGIFTQFIGSFAELCCLEAIKCSKVQETTWQNLADCTVISEPDLRLYKCGLEQRKTDSMVTVLEVKNITKVKNSKNRSKRSRLSVYSSDNGNCNNYSSSSSSVASSSCSSSLLTEDKEEIIVPLIERIINKRVLGQHGGELLFDLNRYHGTLTESILTMPGMIIDQTKVIFTLLIMSRRHFDKLINNFPLESSDRAVIHYSKPLDILSEESRAVLMENFMRLNNI